MSEYIRDLVTKDYNEQNEQRGMRHKMTDFRDYANIAGYYELT